MLVKLHEATGTNRAKNRLKRGKRGGDHFFEK
jgi:hypothetical protein